MCGRYTFVPEPKFYYDFEIENNDFELLPNYNVAPGEIMPVITMNSPKRLQNMKWGLIPSWSKEFKMTFSTINARSEEMGSKPTYRGPLKNKRCLVPSTGFYEWDRKGKVKVPYLFLLTSRKTFTFAGLYEVWKNVEGQEFKSYTIVTTRANGVVGKIHDRMPVILSKEDEEKWANNSEYFPEKLIPLMNPYPDELMDSYRVGLNVNNAKNNFPELMSKFSE
jgi:putative SOS response-associated peptidase YedK